MTQPTYGNFRDGLGQLVLLTRELARPKYLTRRPLVFLLRPVLLNVVVAPPWAHGPISVLAQRHPRHGRFGLSRTRRYATLSVGARAYRVSAAARRCDRLQTDIDVPSRDDTPE